MHVYMLSSVLCVIDLCVACFSCAVLFTPCIVKTWIHVNKSFGLNELGVHNGGSFIWR
jgi:hypothetical protein